MDETMNFIDENKGYCKKSVETMQSKHIYCRCNEQKSELLTLILSLGWL
jgi:hypothetical protein